MLERLLLYGLLIAQCFDLFAMQTSARKRNRSEEKAGSLIHSSSSSFSSSLLPYQGNDTWVESTAVAAYQCLQSDRIPSNARAQELAARCQICQYAAARTRHVAKKGCPQEVTE